jgi:Lon protease-like protein
MMTWLRRLLGVVNPKAVQCKTEADHLEAARHAIMRYYGRPDVDLDRFAEAIAKLVVTSCEEAVQFDRQQDDRRLTDQTLRERQAKFEHDQKERQAKFEHDQREREAIAELAKKQRAAEAELAAKFAEDRINDKRKVIAELRASASFHATDQCACTDASNCHEFATSLLERADLIENGSER